ncbi:hypothetical protein [Novosphingobium sp.]|uniref:hypothetical protein n=1 Tax=Novosphingobium sp. TaxID=1874826 RepID=UPI003BA964BB
MSIATLHHGPLAILRTGAKIASVVMQYPESASHLTQAKERRSGQQACQPAADQPGPQALTFRHIMVTDGYVDVVKITVTKPVSNPFRTVFKNIFRGIRPSP